MNKTPLQKWEFEQIRKIHNTKVKEARYTRKTAKTRNIPRNQSPISLKYILKLFDLQQHEKKLSDQFSKPEELGLLNQIEFENLMDSLPLLPGQKLKFKKMVSEISNKNYKYRSNTAIFPNLSPSSFSSKCKEPSKPLNLIASQELNIRLKNELQVAKAKLATLETQVTLTQKISIPECVLNKKIDKSVTGKSFDSAKMRSTLHNMDIEEVCRCFARVIEKQCKEKKGRINPVIREMNNTFFEENYDEPNESNIYNWIRNIIAKAKIEKEAVVNALVYLERYVNKCEIPVSEESWRKLVFTSLLLASKLGVHYCQPFVQVFEMEEVERMERAFLMLIEFNLKIKQSEYAHAYFLLRTYATDKDKSAPVKFLQVDRVLELQKKIVPEEVIKKTFLKSM